MKVDAPLYSFDAPEPEARRLEAKGYAGAFTFEGPHDPFFPLLLAARAAALPPHPPRHRPRGPQPADRSGSTLRD